MWETHSLKDWRKKIRQAHRNRCIKKKNWAEIQNSTNTIYTFYDLDIQIPQNKQVIEQHLRKFKIYNILIGKKKRLVNGYY